MTLQPPLFPIDQPVMPEERQIGRTKAIQDLQRRVEGAVHQWLVGPRRIGKTSVAKAALARLREGGAVALDVDMSKLRITEAPGLAGELARQAQAAGAGAPMGKRGRRVAARHAPGAQRFGRVLEELGYADEGQALAAAAAMLAGADDGAPGLAGVLDALALHARATGLRVVILLDEVHLLGDLRGAEDDVATASKAVEGPIVFVLAGSEESAVEALRGDDRPLQHVGQEFRLPEISTADWLPGLRGRFIEAGTPVPEAQILAILEASDGHPRRTMLSANYVYEAVMRGGREADEVVVGLAIRNAQRDRAWN